MILGIEKDPKCFETARARVYRAFGVPSPANDDDEAALV